MSTTLIQELEQAAKRAGERCFERHGAQRMCINSQFDGCEHTKEERALRGRAERVRELLAKHGLSEQHGICACGKCAVCDLLALIGTRWADGRPTAPEDWPRTLDTSPETPPKPTPCCYAKDRSLPFHSPDCAGATPRKEGDERMSIQDWQRRFFAAPKVWWVIDPDGNPTNLYESQEAANIELSWRRGRGERGYRVGCQNVHSEALSRERWTSATPPAPPPEPAPVKCSNCFGAGKLSIGWGGARCGYCNGTGRAAPPSP